MVSRVMKAVRELVGGGLTEFHLLQRIADSFQFPIMDEVESSRLTLEQLDLKDIIAEGSDVNLWQQAFGCLNLVSLRLFCQGPEPQEEDQEEEVEEEILKVPKMDIDQDPRLKDLDLQVTDFKVDWNSLAVRTASGLERLKLELDFKSSRGVGLFTNSINGSVLSNSSHCLKILHLTDIHLHHNSTSSQEMVFPNLESVSFSDLGSATWKFFSSLRSPILRDLSIRSSHYYSECYNCVVELLIPHSSKLVNLYLNIEPEEITSEPPPSLRDIALDFDDLENLFIGAFGIQDRSNTLGLEESHYPKLVSLRRDHAGVDTEWNKKLRHLFKKNAPNLEL